MLAHVTAPSGFWLLLIGIAIVACASGWAWGAWAGRTPKERRP